MKKRHRSKAFVVFALLIVVAVVGAGALKLHEEWRLRSYPMYYKEFVAKYSRQYSLDEYFVYAVIRTESGFDPTAVSSVGARGLMQIMSDTFDWVKFRLDDDETDFGLMFDPETNIKYGCYLLSYNLDKFGSEEAAAAAYHAGVGSVSAWLEDERYSKDGSSLDKIPMPDTAHYVDKVAKAYNKYLEIYKD
ncbi:MAG: lytic transglycosylase domain-containing protein [Oscillospiraceae bacterium]|jgi:soluble lytic murein transglycosylase|nr:lytic transglycosylase domain-containing protein [Oscillospiraceae bacterium]